MECGIAEGMREKWLGFVYGERIWKPFKEGGYYVFGPGSKVAEVGGEVKRRRRVVGWEWVGVLTFEERWELVVRVVAYACTLLWDGDGK